MKTSAIVSEPAAFVGDGLLIFCFEDDNAVSPSASALDAQLQGALKNFIDGREEIGKRHKCRELHTHKKIFAEYILVVGLGKKSEITLDVLCGAAAVAIRRVQSLCLKSLGVDLSLLKTKMEAGVAAMAIAEGALSAAYTFERYKKESDRGKNKIKDLVFLADNPQEATALATALDETAKIMDGVYLARDLVSTPSNDMTPEQIAICAKGLEGGDLSVAVFDAPHILGMGMRALYSVCKGSRNEPRFIVMEYRGGQKDAPPIVLVGKGLAFDSGGISLKPSENMGEMKSDMAGAAAVIATIATIAKLKMKRNVVGLIPALENMPDGNAYKPGDIVISLAGHTIEIVNTDAEGRVALADALGYAKRYQPALLVDVATLTGTCAIALGRQLIALMGNNDAAKAAVKKAAADSGEFVWELPLWDGYNEIIKSEIADVINSGGRDAGTITAGLFLAKFVGDNPWVHLDIASTAWTSKERTYIPAGATGVGVRLLVKLIKDGTA